MDDNINIPLSSKINNLNNENEQKKELNIDIQEDIDLDEIFSKKTIYDNIFIKEISLILDNEETIPSLNNISNIYLKKMGNDIVPKDCNSFLGYLIRFIQIIGLVILIFGIFLPNKLLKYHIILCILLLVLWDILDNKCFLSLILQKTSDLNTYPEFIPIDSNFSKKFSLVVMFISIFGLIVPRYSLYRILNEFFLSLKKYD